MLTGRVARRIDAICAVLLLLLGVVLLRWAATYYDLGLAFPLWGGIIISIGSAFFLGRVRWPEVLGLPSATMPPDRVQPASPKADV